jgi:two-component system NtrC family sensor kinase
MKLQTKFGLGIIIVFALLAASIALLSFIWVDQNTIREAQGRVQLHIQASWEIFNGKLDRMQAAMEILARDHQVHAFLQNSHDAALALNTRVNLELLRQSQNMDVLNVMDAEGRVLLRTNAPYTSGDVVTDDPVVRRAITTRKLAAGTVIVSQERLMRAGDELLARCLENGGELRGMMQTVAVPIIAEDRLLGIVQMGSLVNGASEKVDRIRDVVFKNEQYNGKPLGTATIFMDDVRISTNVLDAQGKRAVGTRASPEVVQRVLVEGKPWTGRAWVVDTWYLAQYDPIYDPDGRIVGMLYVGELEQKYLDLRTQALTLFLSVILAGMLLAFVIFFLIVRSIVEPIQQLAYATQRIAAGDLAYRINGEPHSATQDEVKNLALSFDEMAEQLQRQREQIEADRRALEKLNEDLQTTNRNYMEMLGFVSHELKNPLSSAIMNVHTVKDGYVGPLNETQKAALESVAKSLRYFREMIANYLDLSRLEKGELRVNPTRVALQSDVVAPIVEGLARALQEKRMTLENEIPPTLELNADRDLLRIVYDNLLSNAIKYGREGGKIVLAAHADAARVTLSVLNEGEGIPSDKMGLLFKKFSRLTGAGTASKKGTGLGLYICKEIVEKHGGKIWAESQVGAWTKFTFELPK